MSGHCQHKRKRDSAGGADGEAMCTQAEHMAPDAVIEIRSCYTGSVESVMSEIAKITATRVVAFTGIVSKHFCTKRLGRSATIEGSWNKTGHRTGPATL